MDIAIRAATIDDHDVLLPIAAEINVMHAEALPDRFRVADPLPADYFHSLIDAGEATILVAEWGGNLLGYAILKVLETPPIPMIVPRRYVLLNDLVVSEAVRGQGIGRRLVDAAVAWARARGVTEIELGVAEFNESAIAFYERLGFRAIKRTMALPIDMP